MTQSDLATVTINVNAVNDPPVVTVPGVRRPRRTRTRSSPDWTSTIPTRMCCTSPTLPKCASACGWITARCSVTATAGINSLVGNGTGTVIVEGTLQSIQDMLGLGVTYRGSLNYNGTDTLVVTANDLGNTGSGGARQTRRAC